MKSRHTDLVVGDMVVLRVLTEWFFAVITHKSKVTIPADEFLQSSGATIDVLYAANCMFAADNGLRVFGDEEAPIHASVRLFPPLYTFGRNNEETALGRALKCIAANVAVADTETRRQVDGTE